METGSRVHPFPPAPLVHARLHPLRSAVAPRGIFAPRADQPWRRKHPRARCSPTHATATLRVAPPRCAPHHAVPTSRTRRRRLRGQPHGKQSLPACANAHACPPTASSLWPPFPLKTSRSHSAHPRPAHLQTRVSASSALSSRAMLSRARLICSVLILLAISG